MSEQLARNHPIEGYNEVLRVEFSVAIPIAVGPRGIVRDAVFIFCFLKYEHQVGGIKPAPSC